MGSRKKVKSKSEQHRLAIMKPKVKMDYKHYWLCETCANERGGTFPAGHCCTVIHDVCPYCKEKTVIIPYVDFDWPDRDFRLARD